MRFAVVSHSNFVQDREVDAMVAACRRQLREQVAPAWSLDSDYIDVRVFATERLVPAEWQLVLLMDDPDAVAVLGYHTRRGSKVFTKPVRDCGGGILGGIGDGVTPTGNVSVSMVLSHELIETLIDPTCAQWVEGPGDPGKTSMFAQEACDPVEANGYRLDNVLLSNFLLPAWFDADATHGPYDFLGECPGPFSLIGGGYAVLRTQKGNEEQIYASTEANPVNLTRQRTRVKKRGVSGKAMRQVAHTPFTTPTHSSVFASMAPNSPVVAFAVGPRPMVATTSIAERGGNQPHLPEQLASADRNVSNTLSNLAGPIEGMQMSPHFHSSEWTSEKAGVPYPLSEIDDEDPQHRTWGESRLGVLTNEVLEIIRQDCLPGTVNLTDNGGFRPKYLQQQIIDKHGADDGDVASADTSQHPKGRAADIRHSRLTTSQFHLRILLLQRAGKLPKLGGLGLYLTFVHVDCRPWEGHLAQWGGKRSSNLV